MEALENKLKVCPWCKQLPEITSSSYRTSGLMGGRHTEYSIECVSKDKGGKWCSIKPRLTSMATVESAIKVWNRYDD